MSVSTSPDPVPNVSTSFSTTKKTEPPQKTFFEGTTTTVPTPKVILKRLNETRKKTDRNSIFPVERENYNLSFTEKSERLKVRPVSYVKGVPITPVNWFESKK